MGIDNKTIVKSNLKRYRIMFTKMTQKEVALASGIPIRTYQAYEQHERKLSSANGKYVLALAKVFGLDSNMLGILF